MKIDCRGLACPQPVLETKRALENSGTDEVVMLVDNPAAKENVRRFAESQGHRVRVSEEEKGIFQLTIQKGEDGPAGSAQAKEENRILLSSDFVLYIDSDSVGRGSEELGKILMRSLLQTLEQMEPPPKRIILLNSGVKLACEGSEVLEDLEEFSKKGAEVLSCGTCLDFFGIKKKLLVGRISNMYEILNSLASAGKVIKI